MAGLYILKTDVYVVPACLPMLSDITEINSTPAGTGSIAER